MSRIPRHLPGLDADVVAQVDARLARLVADEDVDVLLAIESGSRAWGFASPDSDDDCRFLYRRRFEDYLICWPRRDVLETPSSTSTAGTSSRPSACCCAATRRCSSGCVHRWVYDGDVEVRDEFLALAAEVVDRSRIGSHYAHVGVGALERYARDGAGKAFLYALCPAVAVRWLLARDAEAVPPMDLLTLIVESDPPAGVAAAIGDLVARKAETRELGALPVPDVLQRFVAAELERSVAVSGDRPARGEEADGRAREVADAFFRRTVDRRPPSGAN